ncbi:hypothetical protein [Amaricoccus solimangrovi]|uniref:EF-hand domain-containing protein n=1 Tax=Amaricoccus solimangrovi TaxID=2589815 RepID=A0A501WGS9_9RHOB|nr:hypothetical protein [Amaricoccus solimangrovi]TPE47992.1 hypothetical protein FJM51_18930 [Amaricoccus solimangrovi]
MPRPRTLSLAIAAGLLLGSAGTASATAFGRADTNHDGRVTYEETRTVMPKLKQVSFDRFDTNKDGFIEKNEWSGLDAFYTFTYMQRN